MTTHAACDLKSCPYCPECGVPDARSFADRVALWVDEQTVIREGLWYEGPLLIERLIKHFGSLRALARRACLSPTYISQVRHSNAILSPETFLQLHNLVEDAK